MLYENKAQILKQGLVSDGMGGWIESVEPVLLKELRVAHAPVSTEMMLKEYGIVSTTSMKMYTEDSLPNESDCIIAFNDKHYRILQLSDYDGTKMLLVELIR